MKNKLKSPVGDTKLKPKITAKKWIESLGDPNHVGASEYRVIHDLLTEVQSNWEYDKEKDENAKLDHLDAVLVEVIGWAVSLRHKLRQARQAK